MTHPLLPFELQIVAGATLIAFLAWVLYLVRFHRLSLRDSMLWLFSTALVLLFALFPGLLQGLARAIAVQVPSNALFALGILYLTLNVLSLTIALSFTALVGFVALWPGGGRGLLLLAACWSFPSAPASARRCSTTANRCWSTEILPGTSGKWTS